MALQGPIPVEFGVVFPSGAYAAGAFEPVRNFDASTGEKFVQSTDKASGLPLWVIEVIDADPAARVRAVKVKVAAQAQPVLPAGTAGVAVHPGGVHRADGHAVRQPGRAAGLLAQGNRDPGAGPRPARPGREGGRHEKRRRVVRARRHVRRRGLVDVPEHLRRSHADPGHLVRVDHGVAVDRRPEGRRRGGGVRPGAGRQGGQVRR